LCVSERIWLRRQVGGANRDIFRGGAITTEGGQRIDLGANQLIANAIRYALDDARNLVSWDCGQALGPIAIPIGFRPGQLRWRNASGVDSDESIPGDQLRLWRVLIYKLLRAAARMQSNGFQCDSFFNKAASRLNLSLE